MNHPLALGIRYFSTVNFAAPAGANGRYGEAAIRAGALVLPVAGRHRGVLGHSIPCGPEEILPPDHSADRSEAES